MGLIDAWSRRASERRDKKVEFLGEQTGSMEDTLKRELLLELVTRPDILRAYLARVGGESQADASVALCIVSARPDDRSLVLRVGEIFRRRFAQDAALDILFVSADEEAKLAAVCAPFYRRAT